MPNKRLLKHQKKRLQGKDEWTYPLEKTTSGSHIQKSLDQKEITCQHRKRSFFSFSRMWTTKGHKLSLNWKDKGWDKEDEGRIRWRFICSKGEIESGWKKYVGILMLYTKSNGQLYKN